MRIQLRERNSSSMPAGVVEAAEEMRSRLAPLVGQGHAQGQDKHNLPPTGELCEALALRCCHLASFVFLSQRYKNQEF